MLRDYIKARAAREGVPFSLDLGFFKSKLATGYTTFFGVELVDGELVRDLQEPEPGFLTRWLAARRDGRSN